MKKLLWFGIQQAKSCIFPIVIFLALAVSKQIHIPGLPRYDFILLICILMQIFMICRKLETVDELKVICFFVLMGLALESYKIHMGSWGYPEFSYLKIMGVPAYTGFMYASVASYVIQAERRMDIKFLNWPPQHLTIPLIAAIYLNFFTHHYVYDFRWVLTVAVLIVFLRSTVKFRVIDSVYKMPVALSFFLIGFFIWVAENIATFFSAWAYPNQSGRWQLVHLGKISSWFLFVIISILLVVNLRHIKEGHRAHEKLPVIDKSLSPDFGQKEKIEE